MIKIILTVWILTIATFTFADKISKDENSIYANAFASLISVVTEQTTGPVGRIVLSTDDFVLSRIPDSYNGIEVEKRSKYKPASKYDKAIWIRIEKFTLDQDKVYVFAKILRQTNNEFVNWKNEITSYKLTYQCNFKDSTFDLIDYSEGNAVKQ